MTPTALRSEATEHLRKAQELLALAEAMERSPATTETTQWVSTGRAQQILRANSPSSVYRVIERHPEIGRLVNRRWRIHEAKFRAAIERDRGESGERSGESGEREIAESAR